MNLLVAIYLALGGLWAIGEHRTFEVADDFIDSKGAAVLSTLMLAIHLLRVAFAWPFYLIEDILLYIWDRLYGEEDE